MEGCIRVRRAFIVWYKNGVAPGVARPAVVCLDVTKEWWLDGEYLFDKRNSTKGVGSGRVPKS